MTKQTASETYPYVFNALSISSLADAAVPEDGTLELTYDRTITRPLHLRDENGQKLEGPAHDAAADIIQWVDELVHPFRITFIRASLENDEHVSLQDLDGFRTVCAMQLFYAHACDYALLEGVALDVRPSIRVVSKAETAELDVGFDVRVDADTMADDATQEALRQYCEWGAGTWATLVGELLGPWAVDGGIAEIRLQGTLVPDARYGLETLLQNTAAQASLSN